MKKLLTILFLTLSTTIFSQIAPPRKRINLNLPIPSNQNNVPAGPFMMLGGAAFIAAGALSTPNMVSGSTTEKQPLIKQMHRVLPIVSGSIVFVFGVGFTIGGM